METRCAGHQQADAVLKEQEKPLRTQPRLPLMQLLIKQNSSAWNAFTLPRKVLVLGEIKLFVPSLPPAFPWNLFQIEPLFRMAVADRGKPAASNENSNDPNYKFQTSDSEFRICFEFRISNLVFFLLWVVTQVPSVVSVAAKA